MSLSRPVPCILSLVVLLCAACGGSNSSTPSTAKAHTKINPQDRARAQQIILHLSDLPSGWRAEASKDEGSPKCFKINTNDLTITGKAESKNFVQGDVTTATSLDAIYLNEQQAQAAFKRAASDKLAKCFSDYMKSQSTKDVRITNTSFGRLGFPRLADETSAYQIAIGLESGGLTPTAYVDLVFIRRDRALALLAFIDVFSPFDEQLKERLARTVAARMTAST